ncbi:hypothetical protein E2C01_100603 [Portunus trituberculatus]|uniref:Uncharacterized protein n=1 Tax=Portunus trituberculatus TaxID=210409 RepID=A0A5B7K3J5_PORTR|nr:hypothetical protein [Portunus trituberculatus]
MTLHKENTEILTPLIFPNLVSLDGFRSQGRSSVPYLSYFIFMTVRSDSSAHYETLHQEGKVGRMKA